MKFYPGVKTEGLNENFYRWLIEFDKYMQNNYGIELTITSAYRTTEENEKVGGVPNSSHLKGLAVDVAVASGRQRYYIVKGAMEFGFRRIGVGKYHIHLDMDFNKPYPVIFPDIERR